VKILFCVSWPNKSNRVNKNLGGKISLLSKYFLAENIIFEQKKNFFLAKNFFFAQINFIFLKYDFCAKKYIFVEKSLGHVFFN